MGIGSAWARALWPLFGGVDLHKGQLKPDGQKMPVRFRACVCVCVRLLLFFFDA